jgi:hypothetical protein
VSRTKGMTNSFIDNSTGILNDKEVQNAILEINCQVTQFLKAIIKRRAASRPEIGDESRCNIRK